MLIYKTEKNTPLQRSNPMPNFFQKWKYPYLTAVLISILIAIILLQNQAFKDWLLNLGSLEYIGALVAGALFVSSFTVAISTVVIAIMTENINPMALALIGGVGAVMGDYLVFKLVRSRLSEEVTALIGKDNISY